MINLDIVLSSDGRYKEKPRRKQDIPELNDRDALTALLEQEKTIACVASFLNCSVSLVYRAMKELHIPTARAYAPTHLEHKLNLKKPGAEEKK